MSPSPGTHMRNINGICHVDKIEIDIAANLLSTATPLCCVRALFRPFARIAHLQHKHNRLFHYLDGAGSELKIDFMVHFAFVRCFSARFFTQLGRFMCILTRIEIRFRSRGYAVGQGEKLFPAHKKSQCI